MLSHVLCACPTFVLSLKTSISRISYIVNPKSSNIYTINNIFYKHLSHNNAGKQLLGAFSPQPHLLKFTSYPVSNKKLDLGTNKSQQNLCN